ncbi:MAG: hypothetical protein IPI18_06555 [Saprospiraceae bacterium]|nr:hypothetical protein [Saprospiraceae bacterium]
MTCLTRASESISTGKRISEIELIELMAGILVGKGPGEEEGAEGLMPTGGGTDFLLQLIPASKKRMKQKHVENL